VRYSSHLDRNLTNPMWVTTCTVSGLARVKICILTWLLPLSTRESIRATLHNDWKVVIQVAHFLDPTHCRLRCRRTVSAIRARQWWSATRDPAGSMFNARSRTYTSLARHPHTFRNRSNQSRLIGPYLLAGCFMDDRHSGATGWYLVQGVKRTQTGQWKYHACETKQPSV